MIRLYTSALFSASSGRRPLTWMQHGPPLRPTAMAAAPSGLAAATAGEGRWWPATRGSVRRLGPGRGERCGGASASDVPRRRTNAGMVRPWELTLRRAAAFDASMAHAATWTMQPTGRRAVQALGCSPLCRNWEGAMAQGQNMHRFIVFIALHMHAAHQSIQPWARLVSFSMFTQFQCARTATVTYCKRAGGRKDRDQCVLLCSCRHGCCCCVPPGRNPDLDGKCIVWDHPAGRGREEKSVA